MSAEFISSLHKLHFCQFSEFPLFSRLIYSVIYSCYCSRSQNFVFHQFLLVKQFFINLWKIIKLFFFSKSVFSLVKITQSEILLVRLLKIWTSWRFKGFTLSGVSVSWGRMKYKIKCFSCSSSFSPTKVSRIIFFPANSLLSPRVFFSFSQQEGETEKKELEGKKWVGKRTLPTITQEPKAKHCLGYSLPATGYEEKKGWMKHTHRHRLFSLSFDFFPTPLRSALCH